MILMKRLDYLLIAFLLIAVSVLTSCADRSRRSEIDARKAALEHKQDSTLAATQERLAVVDSLLEAVKKEHDLQHELVMANSTKLKDDSPEVIKLNRLRAHRDSLQAEWQTLGATIRYIKKKKEEAASK